jgi:hypothetical protein
VLFDGAAELDEDLELLGCGAEVPEPVVGQPEELADARRVGELVAELSKRSQSPAVALVIEVVSSPEEPGEVVAAAAAPEAEDLPLDVRRNTTPNPATRAGRGGWAIAPLGAARRLALAGDAVPSRASRGVTPMLVRTAFPFGRARRTPGAEAALPSASRRTPMLSAVVVASSVHQRRVPTP